MIADFIVGEHKQTTAMRFKNTEHYEAQINSIDMDYNADDTIFTGCLYNLISLKLVKLIDQNVEK